MKLYVFPSNENGKTERGRIDLKNKRIKRAREGRKNLKKGIFFYKS